MRLGAAVRVREWRRGPRRDRPQHRADHRPDRAGGRRSRGTAGRVPAVRPHRLCHGFPEAWHDAAFALPGREIERIAEASRRTGAWIAVQVPERHDAFPGRHFLSCVIVGPDDGIALVHRKGYSLSLRTSPIDVYERFVEVFGKDAFHPVIDTPIGRLGAVIGAELHWPEVCRSLALKGTQVVLNPIAAAPHLDYLQRPGALHVRSVRAFENMVYLATANIAGPADTPRRSSSITRAPPSPSLSRVRPRSPSPRSTSPQWKRGAERHPPISSPRSSSHDDPPGPAPPLAPQRMVSAGTIDVRGSRCHGGGYLAQVERALGLNGLCIRAIA
ncbi:nitrilase-related carbon-nitrogen hydrolase [Novosphingobium resinovorum]